MKVMRSALPAVAMAFVAACDDTPAEPDPPLTGSWLYTMFTEEIGDMPQPGDAQCQIFEATMELSQQGTQFDGTIDGTINCAVIGESPEVVFSDQVTNGRLEGDEVSFDIGTWESTGTLLDDSMAGDIRMDLLVDGVQTDLNGEWSATRM